MSAYDQLYEKVREMGLPYKISESGGSIVIKISSNSNQKQFSLPKDKFRFHSIRSFNGSENLNWRKPNTFQEASFITGTSFPDIHFFRDTPAPPPQCPEFPPSAPPPPTPVCSCSSPYSSKSNFCSCS